MVSMKKLRIDLLNNFFLIQLRFYISNTEITESWLILHFQISKIVQSNPLGTRKTIRVKMVYRIFRCGVFHEWVIFVNPGIRIVKNCGIYIPEIPLSLSKKLEKNLFLGFVLLNSLCLSVIKYYFYQFL